MVVNSRTTDESIFAELRKLGLEPVKVQWNIGFPTGYQRTSIQSESAIDGMVVGRCRVVRMLSQHYVSRQLDKFCEHSMLVVSDHRSCFIIDPTDELRAKSEESGSEELKDDFVFPLLGKNIVWMAGKLKSKAESNTTLGNQLSLQFPTVPTVPGLGVSDCFVSIRDSLGEYQFENPPVEREIWDQVVKFAIESSDPNTSKKKGKQKASGKPRKNASRYGSASRDALLRLASNLVFMCGPHSLLGNDEDEKGAPVNPRPPAQLLIPIVERWHEYWISDLDSEYNIAHAKREWAGALVGRIPAHLIQFYAEYLRTIDPILPLGLDLDPDLVRLARLHKAASKLATTGPESLRRIKDELLPFGIYAVSMSDQARILGISKTTVSDLIDTLVNSRVIEVVLRGTPWNGNGDARKNRYRYLLPLTDTISMESAL